MPLHAIILPCEWLVEETVARIREVLIIKKTGKKLIALATVSILSLGSVLTAQATHSPVNGVSDGTILRSVFLYVVIRFLHYQEARYRMYADLFPSYQEA